MVEKTIPRIRTISECMSELRKLDSEVAVSEYYVRKLAKENRIINYRSGVKYYVSLDSLIEFLNGH